MSIADNIKNSISKIWLGQPNKKEPAVESGNSSNDSIDSLNKVNMDNTISNSSANPFLDDDRNEESSSTSFDFNSGQNINSNPFENTSGAEEEKSLLEVIKGIENKDTNYIFLFGRPATGKSYITASLIYYMQTSKLGTLHVAKTNSRESELLIEDMYKNFHSGKLIDRTHRLEPPYEIDLIFTPKDRRLPEMKITFLEISGENLKKVQITKDDSNSGKLPDNIDIYLMCHNIKMIFFLVSAHDTAAEDSLTINKFLSYVYNKDQKFDNSNYLLAITKWDTYRGKHKNIESFTKEIMPNVHNKLIKDHLGNAITHYSIGRILTRQDKGVTINQIQEVDTSRAEAVTSWLYKTITKKSLIPEPSAWERFRNYFGV